MGTVSPQLDELLLQFRVEKYSASKQLDERGWDTNLTSRWRLKTLFPDYMDVTALHLQILEQPILGGNIFSGDKPFRSVYDLDVVQAWELRSIIEKGRQDVRSACENWEIEMSTAYASESNHPRDSEEWWQEMIERTRETERINAPRNELLFGSFNELVGMSDGKEDIALLTVQMEAPDNVIIEHFKAWLAGKRRNSTYHHAAVRRFTPADLSEWAQKRILAYIDLTSLASHFGVKISNHKLGSLIFPDLSDIDVAEKVRKTVAPLARKMMTVDFVETLHYAAAAKQLEMEGS